jgi:hypothetical protein
MGQPVGIESTGVLAVTIQIHGSEMLIGGSWSRSSSTIV